MRIRPVLAGFGTVLVAFALVLVGTGHGAGAIGTTVPLGVADSFGVLAGAAVTNTGPSVIAGDIGVSPGSAIVGFPPGIGLGTFHAADAVAAQAQSDLTVAYNDAAGQAPDATLPPDAGGLTLVGGVYNAQASLGLTGTLTLDAQGNPYTVWVFQIGSVLTTASASQVSLVNGAQPCNVYWQVGSSATLGTGSVFVGNVLALTSITATTGTTIDGRLLARNGAVTLDTNVITRSACALEPEPTTTTSEATTSTVTDDSTSTTVDAGSATTSVESATSVPVAATSAAPPATPPAVAPTTIPTGITLPQTGGEARSTAIAAAIVLALGAGIAFVARRRVSPR